MTLFAQSELTTIKPYSKREASVKNDEDCTDLTLAHRRYFYNQRLYYERHVEELRQKAKDKYDNDPEFRKRKLAGMKERRDRIKLEKASTTI
jgi:hypothetical protein